MTDTLTDTEFLLILDAELEDVIPCNSMQCARAMEGDSHPAKWAATLDVCFHTIYGCEVAYKRWVELTANNLLLNPPRLNPWTCGVCRTKDPRSMLEIWRLDQ